MRRVSTHQKRKFTCDTNKTHKNDEKWEGWKAQLTILASSRVQCNWAGTKTIANLRINWINFRFCRLSFCSLHFASSPPHCSAWSRRHRSHRVASRLRSSVRSRTSNRMEPTIMRKFKAEPVRWTWRIVKNDTGEFMGQLGQEVSV